MSRRKDRFAYLFVALVVAITACYVLTAVASAEKAHVVKMGERQQLLEYLKGRGLSPQVPDMGSLYDWSVQVYSVRLTGCAPSENAVNFVATVGQLLGRSSLTGAGSGRYGVRQMAHIISEPDGACALYVSCAETPNNWLQLYRARADVDPKVAAYELVWALVRYSRQSR